MAKQSQTRKKILKAAADIFSEVGFDGARVDEIADRAGVNKATIYYHIGDKHTLYAETLNHVFGQFLDRLTRNVKPEYSPEKKLQVYIRSLFKTAEKNPHMPPMMMREIASGGKHFPEKVISSMMQILGTLAGIIEDGIKQDTFIETPPFLVHLMIIGTFTFYKTGKSLAFQHIPGSKELQNRLLKSIRENGEEEIEKLVLRAIKKAPSKPPL